MAELKTHDDVNQSVRETIGSPEFRAATIQQLIKTLTDAELDRRTQLLADGLVRIKKLEGELRRIKPDQVVYDAAGKEAVSGYSKAKFEEIKKLQDQIQKAGVAVNNALEKADFQKLEESSKTKEN